MDNAGLNLKSISHSQINSNPGNPAKTLEHKALANAMVDPELRSWYEDAHSYYNAVMSGQEAKPDEAAWNEFLNQMNWAYQQLGTEQSGAAWDLPQGEQGFGNQVSPAPQGAYTGADGSHIYDLESAHIFYDADPTTVHSWSQKNDLDIPSMGSSVEMMLVADEQTGGRKILKVIITGVDGNQKVVTFDNWDHSEFSLDIHAANQENVKVPAELAEKINVDKYQANTKGSGGSAEASLNGEPVVGESVEGIEGGYYYEAGTNQDVFDFFPAAGDNEIHQVIGNANISTPLSSQAEVKKSDNSEYDYQVVVTHKDGSTDTYYVRDEFQTNINAVGEYIQFNVTDFGDIDAGQVPSDLKESFSVNGGVDASGKSALNADDTVPDATGETDPAFFSGDEYSEYTSQESVSLTANFEDGVDLHKIYGRYVEINVSSFKDKVRVIKAGDDYLVLVSNGGKNETYWVDGGVEEIFINGTNVELEGAASGDEKLKGPGVEAVAVPEGEEEIARNDILENFMGILGLNTKSQILNAVKSEFPELNTIEKLEQAILDGDFPPANPSAAELEKVIKVLYILDEDFSGALNSAKGWNGDVFRDAYKAATPRVVDLLRTLYPLSNIKMKNPNSTSWVALNEIEFDGTLFNIFNQKESDKRADEIMVWETVGSRAHNHDDDNK